MSEAPPVDYHGRAPDRHRYRCRTCRVAMSTDDPVAELVAIWKARHAGHEVVEEHDRAEGCSEPDASWCPNCGDCTCPVEIGQDGTARYQVGDEATCPLHGIAAAHA